LIQMASFPSLIRNGSCSIKGRLDDLLTCYINRPHLIEALGMRSGNRRTSMVLTQLMNRTFERGFR
jgi:hypothetical protein